MPALTDLASWRALEDHARTIGRQHLRDLFREQPDGSSRAKPGSRQGSRFERLSFRHEDLLLDLSKHRITGQTLFIDGGLSSI